MSSTKWAQGEWVVKHRNNHELQTAFIGVVIGNEFYDFGFANREDDKANAHLIAAAPDLYAALEALQGEISNELWQSVDAGYALKKARGEL